MVESGVSDVEDFAVPDDVFERQPKRSAVLASAGKSQRDDDTTARTAATKNRGIFAPPEDT
jgi:hypothetical protein